MKSKNIKIKNVNKTNNIIIGIIITLLVTLNIFSITTKINEKEEKQIENKLVNALVENSCYTDISVVDGKLIKSERTWLNDGVYSIDKTYDEAHQERISNNESYKIFILKYYSRDNNELIDTKYVPVSQRNYDILSFEKYNKKYYYEQSSKKIYEFNNPEYDYSKERNYSYFNVEFYSNDTKLFQKRTNEEQIYNFVTSDLDEQEFGTNKKLKKLGKYESKYGTCNIIQGINILYNGENDYYNVIENNEGNHSAIIIHREGFGVDYNNYIDYFKTVISEK